MKVTNDEEKHRNLRINNNSFIGIKLGNHHWFDIPYMPMFRMGIQPFNSYRSMDLVIPCESNIAEQWGWQVMKFIKVRYYDRYTRSEGNDLWLNLDKVIGVDEQSNTVHCIGDYFYRIDEKSVPTLIKALKGGANK